ncbi:hypothetical protein CspHIS471_0208440 [Cutaneotrichosporon sp. HIS471]|nr:hypothetical protein CspHIS471_0208440 [Cutaneotrichosporon sp. HIS471]
MNTDPRDPTRPASPPLPSPRAAPTDGLRPRSLPSRATLRIHIQTPFADQGQHHNHAWDAPQSMTVAEAKDAIASGLAGYGRWERDGLRLVWRGRILRDQDALGTVLTDAAPTLHLVARPIARRPTHITLPPPIQATPTETKTSSPTRSSPDTAALADCVHYLLFATREHLCALIGAEALEWAKTYPAPTVSRDTAKAAVVSVIRPYAESGSWVGWEAAFAADASDWPALQSMWKALGRDTVTAEIRILWKTGTGREFASAGETADVALDHTIYSLHLPPLADMVPIQLIQLLQYLRATTLLSPLSAALSTTQPPESVSIPTPTITTTPPRGITVRHAQRSVTLRVPRISFALLQHQFWSAARLATIVWMLTRGMGWSDQRLWLLAGAAFGWWCVDGYNQWSTETREARVRERRAQRRADAQARLADPEANRAHLEAVARGEARDERPENNPLDPALMATETAETDDARGTSVQQLNAALPLLHLDVDAIQLRLPENDNGNTLRRTPDANPSVLVTHVLLPVYLWFLTLVPAFEARRAREIRARERTMRSVVAEMNVAGDEPDGESRPLMLPDGISRHARKYYARVAERTEGIDWDEEREAQRAMGIQDEEAQPGVALL